METTEMLDAELEIAMLLAKRDSKPVQIALYDGKPSLNDTTMAKGAFKPDCGMIAAVLIVSVLWACLWLS